MRGLAGSFHPQLATKFFQPINLLTQIMLIQELVAKNGQSELLLHAAQLFFNFAQFFHHQEPPRSQKMKTMKSRPRFSHSCLYPFFEGINLKKTKKSCSIPFCTTNSFIIKQRGACQLPRCFDENSSIFFFSIRNLIQTTYQHRRPVHLVHFGCINRG